MKLQLNEKHLDNMALAMRDETRLLVAEGTVRSSKTVTLINIFYNEVKASKERLHLLAAKDYDAIRDNLLECNGLGLLDLHKDVRLVKPKIGSYYLVLKGLDKKWKKVLLAGYSNKDQWKKILGKTLGVILVDEVNTANEQFIDETFARQVSAERPLTLFSLNGDNPKCGLGENKFEFDETTGTVQTATGVIAKQNTLYKNIAKQENLAADRFKKMLIAIKDVNNEYTTNPTLDYEELDITVEFDDNIVEDTDTKRKQDMSEVSAGILSPVEFRMRWYDEDEKTAIAAVQKEGLLFNKYLLILQAGAITPELFVEKVYGENVKNKEDLVEYISQRYAPPSDDNDYDDEDDNQDDDSNVDEDDDE